MLELMDVFLREGHSDINFPLEHDSFPLNILRPVVIKFRDMQQVVIISSLNAERMWLDGTGRMVHRNFPTQDFMPVDRAGYLRKGGYATVDKVMSRISGRE